MLVVYLFLPRHMRDILLILKVSTVELPSTLLIRTLREAVEGMIITPMQAQDILILILPILIILPIPKKSCLILC